MAQLIPVEHDPFDMAAMLAQSGRDQLVPPPENPNAPPSFIPDAAIDAIKSIPRGLLGAQEMFVPQPLTERDRGRLSESRAAQLERAGSPTRGFYDDLRSRTHEPETNAGRYAETLASVLGNPLNWVGPGTVPFKAAWNLASGMGSETAGQAYEGTPWEKSARVVGGWSPMAAERAIALAPRLPQGNVGVFGGKMAVTADHQALNRAQALAKAGTDPNQIWRDTGWFQGADKKWRFEIDDSKAKVTANGGKRLGDVLQHPELYEAYPSLANVKAAPLSEASAKRGATASYQPPTTRFGSGKIEYPTQDPGILFATRDDQLNALLHETQHAVQNKEGFSSGSSRTQELPVAFGVPFRSPAKNTRDFNEAGERYHRNAGEVEARNVERRAGYYTSDRREIAPHETMDVPLEDQSLKPLGSRRLIDSLQLGAAGLLGVTSAAQMAAAIAELRQKKTLIPVDHDPFAQ